MSYQIYLLKKLLKISIYQVNLMEYIAKTNYLNLKKGKIYIINMQNSTDGGGTHWVALFYNFPLYSIYFDSYGYVPPLEIEFKPYIFNDKEIQDYNASSCGYYCIGFIKFLNKLKNKYNSFDAFINIFSNIQKIMTKFYKYVILI